MCEQAVSYGCTPGIQSAAAHQQSAFLVRTIAKLSLVACVARAKVIHIGFIGVNQVFDDLRQKHNTWRGMPKLRIVADEFALKATVHQVPDSIRNRLVISDKHVSPEPALL